MLMIVFAVFALSMSVSLEAHSAIIIDHTCTDISQVPEYWINQGKDLFRISYGHTSHGSQIVTGMDVLKNLYGSLYDFNDSGSGDAISFHDYEPFGDLGYPDWAQRTRDLLNTPGNDRNLIMWSWCSQADTTPENMQIYLDQMSELETDYPDVTFIYMTGHLNGTGEIGNLHQRNNQIRNYVIANNGVLFDFADIESYNPDGNYFLDLWADAACYYAGGNWADEWCAAHPGDDLCTTCECAHSRPLNCNLKGRAFWWMIARLAGWEADLTTSITSTVDSTTSSTTTPLTSTSSLIIPPSSSSSTTTSLETTTSSLTPTSSITTTMPSTTTTTVQLWRNFSIIENTMWQIEGNDNNFIGFRQGKVYRCLTIVDCDILENSFYVSFLGPTFLYYQEGYMVGFLFPLVSLGVLYLPPSLQPYLIHRIDESFYCQGNGG